MSAWEPQHGRNVGVLVDREDLFRLLNELNAQKDITGSFLVTDGSAISFMGAGQEFLLSGGACCIVKGEKVNLVDQLIARKKASGPYMIF